MGLKIQGSIELSEKELETVIKQYVLDTYRVPVANIEFRKSKVIAHVDHEVLESEFKKSAAPPPAPRLQKVKQPKVGGSKHKWSGLYGSVVKIIEKQRARKKKFISFEDLLAELLELKDPGGNRLF